MKNMRQAMTLGDLISTLKRKEPETDVGFDFVYFVPNGIHSYRGYYDQLALGYVHAAKQEINVAKLIAILEDANGKTFTGYKGGDYTMDSRTPVWVANHNEAGGTAIVDVRDDGYRITLVTENIDP